MFVLYCLLVVVIVFLLLLLLVLLFSVVFVVVVVVVVVRYIFSVMHFLYFTLLLKSCVHSEIICRESKAFESVECIWKDNSCSSYCRGSFHHIVFIYILI